MSNAVVKSIHAVREVVSDPARELPALLAG